MSHLCALVLAVAGAVIASILACVPGLHIYGLAGPLLLLLGGPGGVVSGRNLGMLALGMVVGYAVVNTVPSVFLAVPDESTVWIVLPGQQYVLRGRGHEAVVLSGLGSLGALVALLVLSPFAPQAVGSIQRVLQPHLHWLIGLVTLYILVSEWPKGASRGTTAASRLWHAWKPLLAGLATFLLSGVLGVFLTFRSITPVRSAYQSLTPAFVGLFAVPWTLQNVLSRAKVPVQQLSTSVEGTPLQVVSGILAGVLGGLLAAIFPAVTGSIGGLVAGHATAQRSERTFVVSQGANKLAYYVGALLLFYLPGSHLTRGAMAWMVGTLYAPREPSDYWLAVAATALCGSVSIALLLRFSRGMARLVHRLPYRWLSLGVLLLLVALVVAVTGTGGALTLLAATGIGLIPVVCGARRVNCMGVLLVPLLLSMAGIGPLVARRLGLT